MSVRYIDRVWRESTQSGTHLLMLLAIADFADDDGRAYPAVSTLAKKCRMSSRNANLILAALRACGELEVRANKGPAGTNRYRIMLGDKPLKPASPLKDSSPLKRTSPPPPEDPFTPEDAFTLKPASSTPEAGFSKPLKPTSDEPSLNRQEPERGRALRSADSGQGTRLAQDWVLPEAWRTYCADKRPDLDPDAVAENFRDHWRSKPGKDGRKADWLATWQMWVRNERTRGPVRSSNRQAVLAADDVFTGGAR